MANNPIKFCQDGYDGLVLNNRVDLELPSNKRPLQYPVATRIPEIYFDEASDFKLFDIDTNNFDDSMFLMVILWQIMYNENFKCMVIADNKECMRIVSSIIKLFKSVDAAINPTKIEEENKKSLKLENGSMLITSEPSVYATRGFSLNHIFLHYSACTKVVDMEIFLANVTPSLISQEYTYLTIINDGESMADDFQFFDSFHLARKANESGFDDAIHSIIDCAKDDELNSDKLYKKLGEEFGEYGSALLIEAGDLPDKTLDEPALGELADTIIAAVAVHTKHIIEMEGEEALDGFSDDLLDMINFKMNKYKRVIRKKRGQ